MHREAIKLDRKALALAHASPCLALDARAIGQPVALASSPPVPGLTADIGDPAKVVALVKVFGPIAQRAQDDLCGYLDGYDAITKRLVRALDDERVAAVVLVIDSPGGDAAGAWEAVRRMRAAVEESGKPVLAYADECACSAAYAIATVASEIYIPASGEIGSIGVIAVHFDESAAYEAEGVKPSIFRSGARKCDTSPLEPLSDEAARACAERVNELAGQFGELVAEARGQDAAAWLALEGEVFAGQKAVAVGLANGIATLEEVIGKAAAAAQQEKRTMPMDKALADALGVRPEATADELRAIAKAAEVGRAVVLLTGDKSPADAVAAVNGWRADASKVPALEAEVAQVRDSGEKAERRGLALKLIQAKRLFPAETWKKGEDGTPSPDAGVKKAWTTEALRTMVATIDAAPEAFAKPDAKPAPPPAGPRGRSSSPKKVIQLRNIKPEVAEEAKGEFEAALDAQNGGRR